MSSGGMSKGLPQVVRVSRELLAACMTCPLCHKLLREATTISECLHTFCRKCIFEKLSDEEADCCPICNIDLGCVPVEKLRPDHNLQDVRVKIFPYKRRKINAPEVLPSITLPVRRKERSLSSLVVNTPRIGAQTSLTGRRTKAVARRASMLRGLSPVIDEPVKKDADNSEHFSENSSPETLSKFPHSRRQVSSNTETNNSTPSSGTENGRESFVDKSELWRPLNCLVEAANRTKGIKATVQGPVIKVEQENGLSSDAHVHKPKVRDHPSKLKFQDDESNGVPSCPVANKSRKMHGIIRKKRELGPSAQAVVDASDSASERRFSPIWLSLISTFNQKGEKPLPQIPASYIRIKEGNIPVTFLQKYLVQKLNLTSEAEVEIACRGQPVNPALSVHELTEQWLQLGPSERVQASVGTSAKEFVMVLTYRKKSVPS